MTSWLLLLIFIPFFSFSQWNYTEVVTSGLDVYRVADVKSDSSELSLQEYYGDVMFCLHDSTLVSDTKTIILEITYGLTTKTFLLKYLPIYDETLIISQNLKDENYFNYLEISNTVKIFFPVESKCYQFDTRGLLSAYHYVLGI